MNDHLANHIRHGQLKSDSTLYVIGVISNPVRYHSRYRIYREWEKAMKATPNVVLCTVETAFGDRHHEVTEAGNPHHLQLRTNSEIWLKENMINLGVRHLLPHDWKYVAWVDCDVFFRDPGWALETIHQLQHYPVVQPWQSCADLGHHGNILQHFNSFGYVHQMGIPKQRHSHETYYKYAHSGFAWACTRAFWEQVNGLMDFAILGSADHHMAWGIIGQSQLTVHKKMGKTFLNKIMEWEHKAVLVTKKTLGFVTGRIEHMFHGPKKRRYYRERWHILIEHDYDPVKDLMKDPQGLNKLLGKPELEEDIRGYNRSRFEDSIEEN